MGGGGSQPRYYTTVLLHSTHVSMVDRKQTDRYIFLVVDAAGGRVTSDRPSCISGISYGDHNTQSLHISLLALNGIREEVRVYTNINYMTKQYTKLSRR